MFGVACDALSRQINFSTDEEVVDCGKGANVVVSRIQYLFDLHGFGEMDVNILACRQLHRAKQKQLHDTEFCVAHSHKQAYQHHLVIPPCWPYQVCTRLVLWPVQARLQTDEGGESAVHRSRCQHLSRV